MQSLGNICSVTNAGMRCYCDQGCHERGDCCFDIGNTCPGMYIYIASLKCSMHDDHHILLFLFSAPTTLPPTTPHPPPTCASGGYTRCCMRGPGNSCSVTNAGMTCYCDQGCHERGECCSDIETLGCYGIQHVNLIAYY